jgi:hypothetical protein
LGYVLSITAGKPFEPTLLMDRRSVKTLVFFLSCFLGLCLPAWSQKKTNKRTFTENLPNYDNRRIRFGFTIGAGQTIYSRRYADVFLASRDSVVGITPKWSPSFPFLGVMASFKLSDHFYLRTMVAYQFYQRQLDYRFLRGKDNIQINEASYLELPVMLKYKSLRRGNVGMYMVLGIKPGLAVNTRKQEQLEGIKVGKNDFSIEYGFGFDLYYSYFKLSPEIRFSHGLSNQLSNENNVFNRNLRRLSTHNVGIYLNFDGY